MTPAIAAGAVSLLLACSAGAATLIGQPGAGAYYFPNASTPYPSQTAVPPTFVIGAGEEQAITIEGVTTFHVDFDAAALAVLFETSLSNPTLGAVPFSGLIFTSPGFATLASATVNPLTTLGSLDNSRVTLVGDELRLNFGGLSYQTGSLVRLDFTSAAVITTLAVGAIPEPGTWAMMILGFGGVGAMVRRRRTLALPA